MTRKLLTFAVVGLLAVVSVASSPVSTALPSEPIEVTNVVTAPFTVDMRVFDHGDYVNLVLLVYENPLLPGGALSDAWDGSGTMKNLAMKIQSAELEATLHRADGSTETYSGLPTEISQQLTPSLLSRVPAGQVSDVSLAFRISLIDGRLVVPENTHIVSSLVAGLPRLEISSPQDGEGVTPFFGSVASVYWHSSSGFTSSRFADGCGYAASSNTGNIDTRVQASYLCSAGSGSGRIFANSWAQILNPNYAWHVGVRVYDEWHVQTQLSALGIRDAQARFEIILRETDANGGNYREYVGVIYNCISSNCNSGLNTGSYEWNFRFYPQQNYRYSPFLYGNALATACQGDLCRAVGASAYAKSYEFHAVWLRLTAD